MRRTGGAGVDWRQLARAWSNDGEAPTRPAAASRGTGGLKTRPGPASSSASASRSTLPISSFASFRANVPGWPCAPIYYTRQVNTQTGRARVSCCFATTPAVAASGVLGIRQALLFNHGYP